LLEELEKDNRVSGFWRLRKVPGLDIGIITVEPNYDALVPAIRFKIQVKNAILAETITWGLLTCDVYLSVEGKDRWLGKFASILPTPLTDKERELSENFALTMDINNAMSEYLKAIEGEDITFKLIFKTQYQFTSYSGSYLSSKFYGDREFIERRAALPVDKWKRLLSTFYRNITWIAISRETYSLLKEKADREGLTLDEVIRRALIERR